jgi:hypothetical protein
MQVEATELIQMHHLLELSLLLLLYLTFNLLSKVVSSNNKDKRSSGPTTYNAFNT